MPSLQLPCQPNILVQYILALLAITLCMPVAAKVDQLCERTLKPIQFQCFIITQNVFLFFLCVTLLVGQTYNPFIYFRF